MELAELKDYCKELSWYVEHKGEKYEYCDARYKAAQSLYALGYKELAFEQTTKAKNELHKIVKKSTKKITQSGEGLDLFEYDSYCRKLNVETKELKLFWEIMLLEARDKFDSYMLALERNREDKDKYYYPRRDCLRKTGVIQGMQALEDDELNILSISLPPGTGKSLKSTEPVYTPKGIVEIGSLKVGDKVLSIRNRVATVLGVFPQGVLPTYRITFEDGNYVDCSLDHLWLIVGKQKIVNTKTILEGYKTEDMYVPQELGDGIRRRVVKVTNVEYVGDYECVCIYVDNASHLFQTRGRILTHNTTLEKFFCTWVIGRHPNDYSLFFSHSSDITRMFYDGVLDICTNETKYCFQEIFPWMHLDATNAKAGTINFNGYKPFASIQVTSVGAKNSGKVRANRYLYCDDLIGGIEEALNKELLDKLWRIYGTDARQRKLNEQVKEIHIATRWSVHDVIGRLKVLYAGDKKARFIAVPDIDPVSGKSNFEYKWNGMSVEFFNDQAKAMDDITYRCLYKNEPIEREGILYHSDELRRYLKLPEREPDAIYAICDTKNKGSDFMVMPCVYQYGDDYYCVDAVCDDSSDYGVQYQKLASLLFRNNVQQCEFESNSGGDRVSFEVDKIVTEMGGRCNITNKPTESNKETRIIVNADWVKKHILFKDSSMYSLKEDYGIMVSWLCRYSLVGKNTHDDVPDAFANLALYLTKGARRNTVSAVMNPFRCNSQADIYRIGYGMRR